MTKEYKRKRLAEYWAQDIKPKNFGNYFNKAERQRSKSVAASGLDEYEDTLDQKLIRELRWNLEEKLSSECYQQEVMDPANKLNETLIRLGIGNFELWKLHKCTCPNLDSMSDEEILKLSGY